MPTASLFIQTAAGYNANRAGWRFHCGLGRGSLIIEEDREEDGIERVLSSEM
jgi:hypothetical protein